ncbi:MAG: hypothetical protein LUE92_14755 [Clostridiales bacterium]|nr:hypothetical protein [Clostridiales bacterium]
MCNKADTGMRATYSLAADTDKISIQLPPETAFFGEGFSRVFCRLMGVDYFTRIIDFCEKTMTLEIIIPHIQDPDQFKYLYRAEPADDFDDTFCEDIEKSEDVLYGLLGDYVVPRYRRQCIGNLPLAVELPHERDSSRSEHIGKSGGQSIVSKKAFAGIRLTYSFSADKDKIYIQLPPGTPFFGGCVQRVYCRLRGVDYFTRIMEFHKETMTLEIIIPHVQNPNQFKNLSRTELEDDFCKDDGKTGDVLYRLWGDYLVPCYRPSEPQTSHEINIFTSIEKSIKKRPDFY